MSRRRRYVYSYKGSRGSFLKRGLISLLLAGVLAFGASLAYVTAGGVTRIEEDCDTMLVLGCMVYDWGPSILLRDRLDTALAYWQEHPHMTLVVSGGQGADEPTSEARAMHDYLVERGVPSEQILLEERSTNTYENLAFSAALMEENGIDREEEILLVTNDFHLARSSILFGRVFGDTEHLNTLAAPTSHLPSRLKMFIREPLALVKSLVFDR